MIVIEEAPTIEEYRMLRRAAGAGEIGEAAAAAALSRSLFVAVARDASSNPIGTGRVIGDGVCFCQLVDVFVKPGHEQAADAIVSALLAYADREAPAEADVIVMTDLAGIGVYQRHGFKLVYPERYGMSRKREDGG